MEKQGAEVVSVEVPDDHRSDDVPYPEKVMSTVYAPQREIMRKVKNSYWLAHRANRSRARIHYGNVYELPDALGRFDVAVMGSVLLHCRDPLQIIAQCARLTARSMIVVDMYHPELEGAAVCRLVPTAENSCWGTWWRFSTDLLRQYLAVVGFPTALTTTHTQLHRGTAPHTFFTIVASRRR